MPIHPKQSLIPPVTMHAGQQNAGKTSLRAALIDMATASGQRVTESNRTQIETVGIDMSTWESNPTYTHTEVRPDGRILWMQMLVPGPVMLESQLLTSMFSKPLEVLTHRTFVQIVGLVLYIGLQAFMVVRVESPKSDDRVTFVASLLSSGTRSRFTIVSSRWLKVLRWLSTIQKYAMKQFGTLEVSDTPRERIVGDEPVGFARQFNSHCWYYSGSWQNAKAVTFKSHSFHAEFFKGVKGAYQRKKFHLAQGTSKPQVREDAKHHYLDCLCQDNMGTCQSDAFWLSFRWKKSHQRPETTPKTPKASPSSSSDEKSPREKSPQEKSPSSTRETGYFELKRLLTVVSQSISSNILLCCSKQDAQVVDRKPVLLRKILFRILFGNPRGEVWERCKAEANYAALMTRMMKLLLKYLMPADIT